MSDDGLSEADLRAARKTLRRLGVLALVVVLGLSAVGLGVYAQVNEGFVGVEREFGAVTGGTYTPGPHLKVPWVGVQNVETRPRTYTMVDSPGEGNRPAQTDAVPVDSSNGTSHRVDVTIRYRIDPSRAPQFVSEWQNERQVEQRLIRPTVRSTLRDEAAGIPSSEIYRQEGRERLESAVRAALADEFGDEALILEAVQVREITIPDDLRARLNDREAAKIEIETKQNEVEVERREAERRRIEAEAAADVKRIDAQADADAISIRGEALRENPVVLTDRYIDAIGSSGSRVILMGGNDSVSPPLILDTTDDENGGDGRE